MAESTPCLFLSYMYDINLQLRNEGYTFCDLTFHQLVMAHHWVVEKNVNIIQNWQRD